MFTSRLRILWLRSKKDRKECQMTTYHLLACLQTRDLVVISLFCLLFLIHFLNWNTLVVNHLLWIFSQYLFGVDVLSWMKGCRNEGLMLELHFKTKCIMKFVSFSWTYVLHIMSIKTRSMRRVMCISGKNTFKKISLIKIRRKTESPFPIFFPIIGCSIMLWYLYASVYLFGQPLDIKC